MKIGLLGSTGVTGLIFLDKALKAGHTVKALARNPSALPSHSNLEVIKGDVDNQNAVDRVVQGVDVVISTLGSRKNVPGITVVAKGTEAAVNAMKRFGVRRILLLTAAPCTKGNFGKGFGASMIYFIVHDFMLNYIYQDLEAAEKILEKESSLEWTIVQPGQLVPANEVGYALIESGSPVPGGLAKSTFADVAQCLMELAEKKSWICQKAHMDSCTEIRGDPAILDAQVKQIFFDAARDKIIIPLCKISAVIAIAWLAKKFIA